MHGVGQAREVWAEKNCCVLMCDTIVGDGVECGECRWMMVRVWGYVQDVLLQQQVRSATPPLSATSPLAQLAQQAQGLHAERGPQGSQQLGGGQQSSGFASQTAGSGSHGMGGGGSHQSLVLGGGAQQANGVGYGSNVQHGKAIGASALQGLVSAKEEPQSVGHPMKVQAAQLLTPKMEMKAETELDQKVSGWDDAMMLDRSEDVVECG